MNKESKLIFESYCRVVENVMRPNQPVEDVKKVVITKKAYGPSIDLEGPGSEDEYQGYGAMVRDVLDDPEAVSPKSKQALLAQEKDMGQPFEGWDSDVFREYYDVDMEKVVNAWAKKHGYEVEIRDGYEQEDESSEQNINGEFIKNPDGTGYVKGPGSPFGSTTPQQLIQQKRTDMPRKFQTDAPGMYERLQQNQRQDNELYEKIRQVNNHFKDETLVALYKAVVIYKSDPTSLKQSLDSLVDMFNRPEAFKNLPFSNKVKNENSEETVNKLASTVARPEDKIGLVAAKALNSYLNTMPEPDEAFRQAAQRWMRKHNKMIDVRNVLYFDRNGEPVFKETGGSFD